MRRINTEYLRLLLEMALLWCLALSLRPRAPKNPRTILLAVPCLIGEFAAAIPAIADYIARHPEARIDLLVAPSLTPLAERIKGVGNVYSARSVYGRDEQTNSALPLPAHYDLIFAMRMSADARSRVQRLRGALVTSAWPMTRYAFHLAFSLLLRRTPRQWREFNFELLGGKRHVVVFESLISIESSVYEKISRLPALSGEGKKILVHTGATWPMKHWDTDRWAELLNRLHQAGSYQVIFIGSGRIDEQDFTAITPRLGFVAESLIGQLSVVETLALMRRVHGFVGVDSGPANLARLAELPSVTLYGVGPHLYLPHHPRDIAIDKMNGRGLSAMFVASRNGFIHQISVDEVMAAFKQLILKA